MRLVSLSLHLRSLICSQLLVALCAACAAPTPTALPTAPPMFTLNIATVPAGREHLSTWLTLYRGEHPNVEAEILVLDAARALETLARGKADLALIDQLPAPAYRGILTATEVFREPLAVVVHPSNPLRDLTAGVIAELLGGRLSNWGQLGGMDFPVQVYLLPDSAGEMGVLAGEALAGRRLAPQAIVCATPDSLRRAVARDPGGIGVLPYSSIQGQVSALSVDGIPPNSPAYPWRMPLFLVYGSSTPEQALTFSDFVRSKEKGP